MPGERTSHARALSERLQSAHGVKGEPLCAPRIRPAGGPARRPLLLADPLDSLDAMPGGPGNPGTEVRVVRRTGLQPGIAGVRHPNLVVVLDVVLSGSEASIVVERPPGESLAELLRRCPDHRAPPDVVVAIVGGALAGLQMLHGATNAHGVALGFVHRGVSPESIVVGPDGLARLHPICDESPPDYRAPELTGLAPTDARADLYATAAVAFEALTGRTRRPGEASAPSELVPGLPLPLDTVVLRALSPDPSHRQASAADFASDLAIALRPASQERLARWVSELSSSSRRVARPAATAPGLLPLAELPQPRIIVAPPRREGSWLSRVLIFVVVGGLLVGAAWYLIAAARRDVSRSFSLERPGATRRPVLPDRLRGPRPSSSPPPPARQP